MDWKGPLVAGAVVFITAYVFFLQNPLFMANTGPTTSTSGVDVRVTPYLPVNPPTFWAMSGIAYSCGGRGPGVLEITDSGESGVTVASLSLTYGGATYTASGPSCLSAPGSSAVSITALAAPPGAQNSPYDGYLVLSDGTRIPFSGQWA